MHALLVIISKRLSKTNVAQRWNNTVNITQLTHRKHHWCLSWTNINEKSIKIFHSKNTFTVNRKTRHCKLHTGSLYT